MSQEEDHDGDIDDDENEDNGAVIEKEVLVDRVKGTKELTFYVNLSLSVDLVLHAALCIWFIVYNEDNSTSYSVEDSCLDTLVLGIAKVFCFAYLWYDIQSCCLGNGISPPAVLSGKVDNDKLLVLDKPNVWKSRRTFKSMTQKVKLISLFVSVVECNFILGKCLARLVNGVPDDHIPLSLYWASTSVAVIFAIFNTYILHTYTNDLYSLAQEHRCKYRKDTRVARKAIATSSYKQASFSAIASASSPSSASIAPAITSSIDGNNLSTPLLSAAHGVNSTNIEAGVVPGTVATAELSDHPSDDDSSSEDDEELANSLKNPSGRVDAKKARAQERRQKEREQKRQKRSQKKRKISTSSSLSQLLSLAAPDFWYFVVAFIALLVAAFSSAIIPHFTGQVINYVAGAEPNESKFEKATIYLTCAGIICGIFTGIRGSLFTLTMARMDVRTRRALFANLLSFEMGYFDKNKVGEIISRLSSDTTKMSDQISLNINVFLRSVVEAAIVLFLMFRLSWQLSLLSLASMPIMTLISSLYGSFYRKLAGKAQDALADTSSVAEEAIGAMATVKDFAANPAELKAYEEELDRYYQLNKIEAAAYAGFTLTWTTIPSLVTALTLYYGGKLVLERDPSQPCGTHGHLCGGDLVSFMLYQQNLSNALEALGSIMGGIASALGAADKVLQLLNRQPEIKASGKIASEPFIASVELKNVFFSYPARPNITVLNNFSLRVEQGEIIALVGPSGGGKSSIVRLIEHHYKPSQGNVYIGERPVSDYEPGFLHRRMSTVGQEPTLFARSIRRNIIYGLEGENDEPTLGQVVEAAKLANAHDFITNMPKGYATHVGERGVQLSGGQ